MVHKRIKTIRMKKGLTQKDVAERLHKELLVYDRIEAGTIKIDIEELPLFLSALECTIDDLFEAGSFPARKGYILKEEFFNDFTRLMRDVLESQRETEEKNLKFMKDIINLVTRQARMQDI